MKLIKKTPIAISGLALGIATLGNLLASHGELIRLICAIISSIIILLVVLHIFSQFSIFKKQLETIALASVFTTFFMTIALLSPVYAQFVKPLGLMMWYFALFGHLVYLIYFTLKFAIPFKLENVLPSWFIVYVGYVVSANTSVAFGYQQSGRLLVILGFIMFIVLFIIITYRFIKLQSLPDPIKPLIMIYTAPLNLCLVGYLILFERINNIFLIMTLLLSIAIFIFVCTRLFKIIRNGFYPSYSVLTFPIVITMMAYKNIVIYFNNDLMILVNIFELFGVLVIVYVLFKYILFLNKLVKE